MPRRSQRSSVVEALTEALFDRIEAAHGLAVEPSPGDLVRQRQHWLTMANAAGDIGALARTLEILTRSKAAEH